MSGRIENLGLEALTQHEGRAAVLLSTAVMEGKTVKGYLGKPYINKTFKDAELVLRTSYDDIRKNNLITGVDVHFAGRCVWDAVVLEDLTPDEADETEKRILIKDKAGNNGLAVVSVIKADVLPSYSKGTELRIQVAGFPTHISLEDDSGETKEILNEKGVESDFEFIFPTIIKRKVDKDGRFEISDIDDTNIVRGTIKRMRYGRFEFDGKENRTFVIITVNTQFGELDLAVSFDTIDRIGAGRFVEGATVFAEAVLTGDVAIYDYEFGNIRDEEHDILALGYTITDGNAKRISEIMAENCEYNSTVSGKTERGSCQLISMFDRMAGSLKDSVRTYLAKIEESPIDSEIGRMCLIIEYSDGDRSLLLTEYNQNNKISKINICDSASYKYRIIR